MLFRSGSKVSTPGGVEPFAPNTADAAVRDAWTLDDAELTFRRIPQQNVLELRSGRVFLSPAVADAASLADANQPTGVFTYFVNTLRTGDKTTPYSMVSGLGPLRDDNRPTPPVPLNLEATVSSSTSGSPTTWMPPPASRWS